KDHLIVQVHAYFWAWVSDENGGHREYWGTKEDKDFVDEIVELMKRYSQKLNAPIMNGETGTDKYYDEKVMAEYAAYCSAIHAEAGIPYVWCNQIFNSRTNEEFYPLVLDEISKGTHSGKLHAPKAKAYADKNTVTLSWREVNAADGYNVYKYNAKTQKYELIEYTENCSISFSGLAKGTYKYKLSTVCTYNGKKTEGALSDIVTAKITGKPAADAGFEQAAQAAANMGAGYILDNSFDYKGTDLKYNAANNDFETRHWEPVTTKEHIALIKDAGFDTLRIPIEWLNHCNSKGAVSSKWLNRIKQVVDWALAEDMYVIINMQSGISEDYGSAKLMATRASYEKYSGTVRKIWTAVSKLFKDYDDKLIFGGISELITFDQGGYNWRNDDGGVSGYWINKWNELFVDTVRQTGGNNQYRNLCISTYSSALFNESMTPLYPTFLEDVEVPDDIYDGHILLDLHYTCKRLGDKWGSKADKKAADEIISMLDEYSERLGLPIIMGEFSVTGSDDINYYTNNDAVTEYLGYWAQSAARIGVPIVYKHYYGSLVDRWNMKLWDGDRAIANTLTVNANLGKLAAPEAKASVKGKKVTLKWDPVAGAYGYKIYEYNSATKKYEQKAFVKSAGKTFNGLSKGAHKYKIVTVSKFNGKNTSGNYSDVITVRV
ncbi:MAG: cellulase family glycosylhydrolase, partial [Oscillospiraceae bacterium]